jgi:hypothetical protein
MLGMRWLAVGWAVALLSCGSPDAGSVGDGGPRADAASRLASGSGAGSGSGSSDDASPPGEAGANTASADAASGGPISGGGAACKGIAAAMTTPTDAGATVSVTIDVAGGGACTIAPDFAGTNYESFSKWGADISMNAFQKQAFQAAGTRMFRYPGGEPGEWTDLLMTGKCMDGSDANWGSPPYASLWTFAQSAGLRSLMLQTNPTTQWCGNASQDASGTHAAALASDAAAHGVRAVYEVGNEPDTSGSYFAMMSGGQSAYIAKFIEHANAIHGVQPTAEVYGPAVCGLGGNCSFPTTWDSGWLDAFLMQTGNKASGTGKGSVDGISFHVYWHPEWSYSDLKQANIDKYGFAPYWSQTVMPYLRALIAKYDTRDLPIAISEISIGNGIASDSSQTQNMFTVLESLDTIGAFASSGLRSFQWFDANAAGPSDFWMITTSAARPIYYSFAAWSQMGDVVLDLTSSASSHDIGAYVTRKSDGSVQVLLINKTASSHTVTMTFKGFAATGKALQTFTARPATAGSDTSTSVVYNGATDPLPASLPAPVTSTNANATPSFALDAYSLAVLAFGP